MKKIAIYFDLTQFHQQGIVHGVFRYARMREDWRLFGAYWPMLQVNDFRTWRGDGIIADVQTLEEVELLSSAGVPVVDTACCVTDPRMTLVTNDNIATGRVAATHLIENGFASFAFCGADKMLWSEERLEGFRQALDHRRRSPAVFNRKLSWWHSSSFSALFGRWLAKMRLPLGVFAGNDIIGMNVVSACRLAGLRIPEDVAVVSVDNEEMLCEMSNPPLSSIPFDRSEIGMRAAELLSSLMEGESIQSTPMRIQPHPLVVRASSLAMAFSDPLIGSLVAYIRRNALNFLSVSDVAAMFNLSRRNLERRFRKQVGHSMLEEIHKVRVEAARDLLVETDMPLSKVAYRCGFKTPARFGVAFGKMFGLAPAEYRALNR